MERDFKGVWIPAEVWLDDNLTTKEKFYLAVYNECSSHVTATELLSPLFSRQTANRILNALIFKGYLKRDHAASPEAAKDYVLKHKNEGERCEWCGTPNIVLHEHHYPIPKSKGGTETVKICPNCHCAYHAVFKEEQDGDIQGQQE